MTDDLVAWLRTQLNDDEQVARDALGLNPRRWRLAGSSILARREGGSETVVAPTVWPQEGRHIVLHDPARVLAEVDAKRAILRRGGPVCTCADQSQPMNPDTNWTTPLEHHLDCAAYETARLLAAPYDDRPGYRPEWGTR